MIIGIYRSKECENEMLKKPEDGKLSVIIFKPCSWCNQTHRFELYRLVQE